MDEEKLKQRIGENIAFLRKKSRLTQAGLGEKLNYSDKAVSKWERGESLPDMLTMVLLAEQFGVTVDELVGEENTARTENLAEQDTGNQKPKRRADKRIILKLSSILVWFVALLVFVILSSAEIPYSWISFFYAVPVNAIVLLSLRSAWHNFSRNQLLISVIVWGCLLSIHSTIWVFTGVNLWKIYLLGIPGQLAVCLWFRMFKPLSEQEEQIHE